MPGFVQPPAPGFHEPLDLLSACHGRIRERLDTLERLPRHLEWRGSDSHAQTAARRVIDYFDRAAPHHHADEEADLFPMLLAARGRPGWDEELPALLARLEREHPMLEKGWDSLRDGLAAVAEGRDAVLEDAAEWIAAFREHLTLEEDHVLPLAERVLTDRELETLGHTMAARRGVAFPRG